VDATVSIKPMLSGRWVLKNASDPAGAYAIDPLMLANAAADKMLSAASRKKTVLSIAASSIVRGGTRRVLVLPAIDALAMTAIAHTDRKCQCRPLPVDASTSLSGRGTVNLVSLQNCGRLAISVARVPRLKSGKSASFEILRGLHRYLHISWRGLRLCCAHGTSERSGRQPRTRSPSHPPSADRTAAAPRCQANTMMLASRT
jgi:hypothetical protein